MPAGRPKGSKNKKTIRKERALSGGAYPMLRKTSAQDVAVETVNAVPDFEDNINAKMIMMIRAARQIAQKADKNNVYTLYDCLDEYLALCAQYNVNVTNLGCYSACGLHINTVDNWYHGRERAKTPEYREFATYLKAVCAEYRGMQMASGKLNPVTGIWWEKVYNGYSEGVQAVPEKSNDEGSTSDEIAKKYGEIDE